MTSYSQFFSGTATVAGALVGLLFVGIARSWELLGLRGGGPLDLLAQRLSSREPRSRGSAVPPAPPASTPGSE